MQINYAADKYSFNLLPANASGQCGTSDSTASATINFETSAAISGLPLTATSTPSMFFNLANGTCLWCPSTCVTCLSIVDDVTNPCTACQSGLGLVPNFRSTLSSGGTCARCSTQGLLESRGSSRLRLAQLSTSAASDDDAGWLLPSTTFEGISQVDVYPFQKLLEFE